jgi:hypothetical protein
MAQAKGQSTYSFKDTTGAFVSPLAGTLQIAGGKIGAGKFEIENSTTRSEQDTASDGAVMVSYIAGDAGSFQIEVQQTSIIHKFLLAAFNLHKTAADAGDVSNWASSDLFLRNILDGSQHVLNGISFTKIPTKTYAGRGGMLTWVLMAANSTQL